MERCHILDVVVRQLLAVIKHVKEVDEFLLSHGDAGVVLDIRLQIGDGVIRFHHEVGCIATEGLNFDDHGWAGTGTALGCSQMALSQNGCRR